MFSFSSKLDVLILIYKKKPEYVACIAGGIRERANGGAVTFPRSGEAASELSLDCSPIHSRSRLRYQTREIPPATQARL